MQFNLKEDITDKLIQCRLRFVKTANPTRAPMVRGDTYLQNIGKKNEKLQMNVFHE